MSLSKDIRERIKATGRWDDFVALRESHKLRGCTVDDANLKASEEILSGKVAQDTAPPLADILEPHIDLSGLLGRTSKPAELIQWVASNMQGDPDLASCPGRDAYALLNACRRFPSFELDFWKTMYVRLIPSRALVSDDGDGQMDGQPFINVLEKIAGIYERVSGSGVAQTAARLVHIQEAAGSIPAPATNPLVEAVA